MWGFLNITNMVVSRLERDIDWSKDVVSKILVARKFAISRWFPELYEDLVRRKEPLTLSEMNSLGFTFVAKITKIREERISLEKCSCEICTKVKGRKECWSSAVRSRIRVEFKLEK